MYSILTSPVKYKYIYYMGGNIMKQKALLVGINQYPSAPLRGCVNDVMLINDIIRNQFGFTEIRVLTDLQASTKNILDGLEWLVLDAQSGDTLLFHYSGHGSQIPCLNGSEPDGYEEIICPQDLNWKDKMIIDDDFNQIFSKVPAGVNLTCIFDCCHSGSGLRTLENPFIENKTESKVLPTPEEIKGEKVMLNMEPSTRQIYNEYDDQIGILISGCKSYQTSADAFINRKYHGALTFYLAQTLNENKYDICYDDLVKNTISEIHTNGYEQTPELNCKTEYYTKKFLKPF